MQIQNIQDANPLVSFLRWQLVWPIRCPTASLLLPTMVKKYYLNIVNISISITGCINMELVKLKMINFALLLFQHLNYTNKCRGTCAHFHFLFFLVDLCFCLLCLKCLSAYSYHVRNEAK